MEPWSPPQPATVATTASPLQTLLLQFRLLLKKNWFVVKRGWALTATQVLIPLIMGLVLFTLRADDLYTEDGFNANTFAVVTPPVHYIGPLAACGPKDAADCVPLGVVFNSRLASASAQTTVDSVVAHILADNPQVGASSVRYYEDADALAQDLLARPTSLVAVAHFSDTFGLSDPSFAVIYNNSAVCSFGGFLCDEPWRDRQLPLQLAIERALLQEAAAHNLGASGRLNLTVGTAAFPHPDMPEFRRDLSLAYGTQLFTVALLVNLMVQLRQLEPRPFRPPSMDRRSRPCDDRCSCGSSCRRRTSSCGCCSR